MRRSTAPWRLAFGFVASLAACGGGGGTTEPAPSPQPPPPPATSQRLMDQTLVVDGRTRSYNLNLPPVYATATNVPLVIGLHGGGGSGAQFESSSRFTPKADAAGVAVVYPTGTAGALPLNTWNGGGCCGYAASSNIDDVNFIRQLIVHLTATYKIDPKRIYATGHSNGGILSYRLACDLADRIAAIAPNAAADMTASCAPARPVPVLHMHSRLDTSVPIAGGFGTGISGASFTPLDTTLARWATLDGCAAMPPVETVTTNLTHRVWQGCGAAAVELLLTDDGGHAWPGGDPNPPSGDAPSTAIDANDRALAFFARFALP